MTTSIVLSDILSYSLQLTLVIGAGAALAVVFRIREPRVTLACWRTLLVVCLVLPLCQPWLTSDVPIAAPSIAPQGIEVEAQFSPAVGVAAWWSITSFALLILCAGATIRAVWLTTGAWTLARLRRTAQPLAPLPAAFCEAEARIGVQPGIYVSDRIAGPITFGWRRPVVIVPPAVLEMPLHVQEAIAYHELLHVRRRDWLFEVLEEAVRTVFWFHPAMWWLIGRVQLSREQVVDAAAVGLTDSKENYVDALLLVALNKVALNKLRVSLVPAPLFLRRSLLRQRVAQILQETSMTTHRLTASLTVSSAALALAATVAVRSFPLEAQGTQGFAQASVDGPIQIVKGGDHLLHASFSEYPRRAIEQQVQGDVVLDLVTDDRGEVSDARVLSGPEELRRAALESVLQWHYSPDALRSTSLQTTLRFSLPAGDSEREARAHTLRAKHEDDEKANDSPAARAEHVVKELSEALQDPSASDQQKDEWKRSYAEKATLLEKIRADLAEGRESVYTIRTARPLFEGSPRLVQIRSDRVIAATMNELVRRAGISVGDQISEETAKRIRDLAASLDEHLRVSFRGDGKGGVIIMVLNP
jgi:bla regulator protein blaR1